LKDTSNNVIFDFCFIPHVPNWLVSLSGDSQIRIWDIETQSYWLLFGHTKSVRSASVWPDNPCIIFLHTYLPILNTKPVLTFDLLLKCLFFQISWWLDHGMAQFFVGIFVHKNKV
jgi:WD40 repeat protein